MEVCWKLLTFGVQIIGQAIVFSVILDIVISLFWFVCFFFFSPPTLSDLLLMLNSWVNSNIAILDKNIAKTGWWLNNVLQSAVLGMIIKKVR